MKAVECIPVAHGQATGVGPMTALGGVLGAILSGLYAAVGSVNWLAVAQFIGANWQTILKDVQDVTSGSIPLQTKIDELAALLKSALGL